MTTSTRADDSSDADSAGTRRVTRAHDDYIILHGTHAIRVFAATAIPYLICCRFRESTVMYVGVRNVYDATPVRT